MNTRLKMRLYLAACVASIYVLPAILLFVMRPTAAIEIYWLMTLPAIVIWVITVRYYDAEIDKLIAILKKSSENSETAIQAAKEAIDIARQLEKELNKSLELGNNLVETENKSLDELMQYIGFLEQAAAEVQEQLQSAPRKRGRPSSVITFPGADGKGINKPITDPATMAYLIRLQEAKERGELTQALTENPYKGPAIPETTARDWLRRYKGEISAARNSGNYS